MFSLIAFPVPDLKGSMMRAFFWGLFFVLVLVLGACSRGPVVVNPTLVGAPGTMVTYPEAEYKINVGDQLDIKLFYNPELNEQVLVRPDGRISLQLVNEVVAAGRTPAELRQELREKYATDLANPEVAVIVRSFTSHKVFVDGEVNKPGMVPMLGPLTVLQSIAQCSGMKDTARPDEVVVVRRTPDGKPAAIPVNLVNVINGTDMKQDIYLAPYDIVFIPMSNIANVNKWVDQYLRKTILVLPNEFMIWYSLTR